MYSSIYLGHRTTNTDIDRFVFTCNFSKLKRLIGHVPQEIEI